MIRVKCPKCEKKLGIDDSKAGAVALCPACQTKFRVPAPKKPVEEEPVEVAADEDEAPPPPKKTAPAPTGIKKPAPAVKKPVIGDDEDDPNPYTVVKDEEDEAPKKRRRRDEEDEQDEDDRPRTKKKKKKKSSTAIDLDTGILLGLVGGVLLLWLGLLVLAAIPGTSKIGVWGSFIVGGILAVVGRLWIMHYADQDGVGWMVRWIPFYELYYILTNFGRLWPALSLNLGGIVIIASGAIVGLIFHPEVFGDEDGSLRQRAPLVVAWAPPTRAVHPVE